MKNPLHALFLLCTPYVFSQDTAGFFSPSPEFSKNRFTGVATVQSAGYAGSIAALSAAWYSGYTRTSFHSFDDSPEWLQMDKAGHLITSWYLGRVSSDMYEWSGVKKKKAVLFGALSGWGYLTAIETMDGFSDGWGFSWSDFGANTLGSGLIIGQKFLDTKNSLLAKGFRGMSIKFSFHQTIFPQFREELLGKNFGEQLVKDYNGQTYWLSFNLSSLAGNYFKKGAWQPFPSSVESGRFPKWLNIAFGYGAEGMISGRPGYSYTYPNGNTIEFERYRQYYLSLDIDLSRIKTKSHFLKALAETFCFIKIPAPALEWNKYGMKFHPFYY